MINKTIARRYAQALFEIAQDQNAVDNYLQDLKQLVEIFNRAEVKKIIYSRLVSGAAKKEIVNHLAIKGINPMVVNFVHLVFDKSREEYLPAIFEAFSGLVDQEKKILPAAVKSAITLSEDQIRRLEEKLSLITGKKVRASVETDSSLLGGLTVKIGDVLYDGSIAKQLRTLREHLQQVQLGR
ncbi:MAG: ATP synthase F1 subunit delta [Bacillota bacterium]|jgi:F-type H+-transporting ATPase subunit delta